MKKAVLFMTSCSLVCSMQLLAQNTNTLLPFGNVGIGTLLPSAKLEVKGNSLLQTLTVTGDGLFKENTLFQKDLSVVGSTYLNTTRIAGGLSLPSLSVSAVPANGAQVLVRDPQNGNVAALDVSNFFYAPIGLDLAPCSPADAVTPHWASGPYTLTVRCPQVKVGIGTSSPQQALHVDGSGLFNKSLQVDQTITVGLGTIAASGNLRIQNFSGTALDIKFANNTSTAIKVSNADGSLSPFILGTDGRLTIHNGTRKTLQLNPDGTLFTRTVQVDAVNWPDYVFESDYNLMPISDLETFIQKNKHLPNVPDEENAEANGIDLGEMNKVLLEKTEEMTLYIIGQQKQIDNQQKQIDELKSQVQLLLNNK